MRVASHTLVLGLSLLEFSLYDDDDGSFGEDDAEVEKFSGFAYVKDACKFLFAEDRAPILRKEHNWYQASQEYLPDETGLGQILETDSLEQNQSIG